MADRYYDRQADMKWIEQIPNMKFPPEWEVRIIPPFAGAVVRFLVLCNGKRISVYLDCYESLGCFGAPYWEAYPIDGDVGRWAMSDVEGLIAGITEEIASV